MSRSTLKTDLDKAVLWSSRMMRGGTWRSLFSRGISQQNPRLSPELDHSCECAVFRGTTLGCELGLMADGVNSMLNDVASLESGYDPTSAPPTDKEIESEVAHLVRGLCQAVATRHFVEAHTELIRDVEDLQRRVWLQAERRYDQRT